eukprot:TRINITY_DN66921_c5_g2_i4.p1 TRINITY_DN66921_c5_g2~~TRINITY_DN66921_c5_g2_i4.p1  ORF type:complete len:281 (+),score=10.53 TRINITY_DN66921_c5_g2_i4:816-1658(+)
MLQVLNRKLQGGATVYSHKLQRKPRKEREDTGARMQDTSEHLVVITAVVPPFVPWIRHSSFHSDPGKGYLAVKVAPKIIVVCIHLSYLDYNADAQLKDILTVLAAERSEGAQCILAGDWNHRHEWLAQQYLTPPMDAVVEYKPVEEEALPPEVRKHADAYHTKVDHIALFHPVPMHRDVIEAPIAEDKPLKSNTSGLVEMETDPAPPAPQVDVAPKVGDPTDLAVVTPSGGRSPRTPEKKKPVTDKVTIGHRTVHIATKPEVLVPMDCVSDHCPLLQLVK